MRRKVKPFFKRQRQRGRGKAKASPPLYTSSSCATEYWQPSGRSLMEDIEVALDRCATSGGNDWRFPIPDYTRFTRWVSEKIDSDRTRAVIFTRHHDPSALATPAYRLLPLLTSLRVAYLGRCQDSGKGPDS